MEILVVYVYVYCGDAKLRYMLFMEILSLGGDSKLRYRFITEIFESNSVLIRVIRIIRVIRVIKVIMEFLESNNTLMQKYVRVTMTVKGAKVTTTVKGAKVTTTVKGAKVTMTVKGAKVMMAVKGVRVTMTVKDALLKTTNYLQMIDSEENEFSRKYIVYVKKHHRRFWLKAKNDIFMI
jgi:hypothetical protein